jgi:3-mercaptopyruvate sulfurtransferase SseA
MIYLFFKRNLQPLRFVILASLAGSWAIGNLAGCQLNPTKVSVELPVMSAKVAVQEVLKKDPVIVDARSFFDFNAGHAPGAVFVDWRDLQSPRDKALLDSDVSSLAQRLALKGISPKRPVVVVGKGLKGDGAEGRVAWILKNLGVLEVYLLRESDLRISNKMQSSETKNAPSWRPNDYFEKHQSVCPSGARMLWVNSDEGQSQCRVEFVRLSEWMTSDYRLIPSRQGDLKSSDVIVIGPKQNPKASLLAFVLREAGIKSVYLY